MMWRRLSFQLLELLGEGGQGSVYKALRHDRASGLKQTVALKILHSETAVELWRQEFESLSRVRSPYCVQVLSFERFDRSPALVLEFVDGVSLAQLARTCILTSDDIEELLAQMEMGLKDLHRQGVLHGDLSPQNVLLDTEGRIRLLDFGLANCNTLRMTPEFAAPERLQGQQATASGDIFALGRIERFLRIDVESEIYTQQRRFQDLSPSFTRQEILAEKVKHLLERQKILPTKTQAPSVQKTWRSQAFVLASITSLLVLLIPRASHSVRPGPLAVLSVRTQKWIYLQLGDRILGYAPLSVPLEAGRTYHLHWASSHDHGDKDVVLSERQTLLLEDSDFSH